MKNFFSLSMFHIRRHGFTLVELLVVIGIIAIITGFSYMSLSGFKNRRSFDLDAEKIVEGIRNAQNSSIVQEQGAAWQIVFANTITTNVSFEIRKATATSSITGKTTLSSGSFSNLSSGATTSIVFEARTGKPSDGVAHTLVFKRKNATDTYIITVSVQGVITRRFETGLAMGLLFDEATSTLSYDISGTGNNATLYNTTWSTTGCRSGSCLYFNGNPSAYASFGTTQFGSTQGTISLWVKATGVSTDSFLFYHQNAGENLNIRPNNPSRFIVDIDDGSYYAYAAPYEGEWVHYVLTYDNQAGISFFYRNGAAVSSSTYATNGTLLFGSTARIGYSTGSGFYGLIDDVRVYDHALTQQEVQSLYASY